MGVSRDLFTNPTLNQPNSEPLHPFPRLTKYILSYILPVV